MDRANPKHFILHNPNSHFEWIDILRGVSVLAILLFHVRVDPWVGWNEIWSQPESYSSLDRFMALLAIPTPFLGSAVMLFFLISGFCIQYPFAQGRSFHASNYFFRRFLRIYPSYLAAVAFSEFVEWTLHRYGAGPDLSLSN